MELQGRAYLRGLRITPRKVGMIADQVRGKELALAMSYLRFSPRKRTSKAILGVLSSAYLNIWDLYKGVKLGNRKLFVKEILVGPGKTMKRFRPKAKGSAGRILKRTSNVRVLVATTL